MRTVFGSFIIAAFFMAALPANAAVADGTTIDKTTIAPLMDWVEQQTGTHIPRLPHVIASNSHFTLILDDLDGGFFGRPKSAYIPGTVIMDNQTWDAHDPVQLSLLVHELVHHAQMFMTGAVWTCSKAREAQAYNLQNKWLKEHGQSAFVSTAWIERISSCSNPGATASIKPGTIKSASNSAFF